MPKASESEAPPKTPACQWHIDDASPCLCEKYDPNSECKRLCRIRNRHAGQMKLLLSEIGFLNDFAEAGAEVVYAGAADGQHVPTLDCMFAPLQLRWHLFDPAKFSPEVMAWSKRNRRRVFLYNQLFSAEDAAYFKGFRAVLFISDVRTKEDESRRDTSPEDDHIMQNQRMQLQWVRIMDPAACCLKFRGAFSYRDDDEAGGQFEYLRGELRVQAWAPPNSTELRLVASRPYSMRAYSSRHLDQAMSYYNERCRLVEGNDAKLQAHVLQAYAENRKLLPSEQAREAGRLAFDVFERAYIGRKREAEGHPSLKNKQQQNVYSSSSSS